MGLSMISIILFHQKFIGGFPTGVFHCCGYWGVDVFLMLSGIGMVFSLQTHSLKRFYKRRFVRLFPTCLFCGVLKCCALYFMDESTFWDSISISKLLCFDLWFIRAIIFYYAISPLLFYAIQKLPKITLVVLAIVYFSNGLFFRVHDAGSFTWIIERLFVFSLGMFLALKKEYLNRMTVKISVFFLCVAMVIVLLEGRPVTKPTLWTTLMFSVALCCIGLLNIGVALLSHCKKFILFIPNMFGKISLELYLFHEFVFYWGNYYLNNCVHPALLFSACLLLCICLSFTSQKVVKFVNLDKSSPTHPVPA